MLTVNLLFVLYSYFIIFLWGVLCVRAHACKYRSGASKDAPDLPKIQQVALALKAVPLLARLQT